MDCVDTTQRGTGHRAQRNWTSGAPLRYRRAIIQEGVGLVVEGEIYARLTTVFLDVFDQEVTLAPQTTADDVEGWNSLSHIRLILAVEKEFRVRFAASEVGMLKNV
jgi:acyl carrier protein